MNHNRNAHYWENRDERKERAYLHTKNMAYVFSDHIEQCVRNTKLYDDTNTFDELNPVLTREVSVVDLDTVSAIFRYKRKEKRTAILNFASYKNAGGMFLQGSSAQEESLCHASFLYNVLSEFKDYYAWNDKHKNRALYENRALYSPDVVFTNDSVGTLCDVITCAAPNKSGLIGAGVAVGLIFLGCMFYTGVSQYLGQTRVVTVKGLAEREVPADQVIWPITFKETGDNLLTTHTKVEADSQKVVAFLKKSGLEDSEFSFGAPEIQDRNAEGMDMRGPRYTLTGSITVNSTKVDQVRRLMAAQKELIGEGVPVTTDKWNTVFLYTKLNTVKPAMVEEATKNAREVAQKFAADSGSHIGKIKSANQGQFSITDANQSTPYEKKVRVVTTVTYFLKD